MGSVATAGRDGRLGLLNPLALIAMILCSYSRPSISSVDLYLVIVMGFLLARTHLSDLTSLRSMMYPETSSPPSSSGGCHTTVMPSRETSNMVGRPGGPGTSVEEEKLVTILQLTYSNSVNIISAKCLIWEKTSLTLQAPASDDIRLQELSSAVPIHSSCTEDILISLDQILKLEGWSANRVADRHPAGSVSITLLHHIATDGSSTISDRRIPAAGNGGCINLIKPDGSLWLIRFSW